MATFYSASNRAFYDSSIHPTLPPDAVEITQEYYIELMNGQATGLDIEPDENGYPILVDNPEPVDRRGEILTRLSEIDAASIRPLRAMASGTQMDEDIDSLSTLETEAAALRLELASLPEPE